MKLRYPVRCMRNTVKVHPPVSVEQKWESIVKMKSKRTPRVKIDSVDLQSFLYEQLEVDSYWHDLYNPPENPKKKKSKRKS